ncbi:phage terminase large subunit [Ethanoligenens harbinense]|uniref:phage terminase large subunit n=1 Tax=Ethanoligenens harbinense TaxID=253239 RepID=UPI0010C11948|nr:phage terminase large subunit [Ethanoligenens harbinense]QCN91101.1 terminase [Ethanoligenens harbinense]
MENKQDRSIRLLDEMVRLGKRTRRKRGTVTTAEIRRAQRDFFTFCRVCAPQFYKPDRAYLVRLCAELQDFYNSDDELLVINLPPRHGKSRTAGLFAQWIFGGHPSEKIMTGSYNERLSTQFAKSVRNGIAEQKTDPGMLVYSDIFPGVRIQRGDAAANLWALEGQYASYLATSPTGTATGFGCGLLIIDDVIKNAYEANNAPLLDNLWHWFTDTMLSRVEENGKIIIIMTRWATKDLAGQAVKTFTEQGRPFRVLSMKALQDDGAMLCPEVLSRRSYENKTRTMAREIAAANYQQEPIDIKGRLYSGFKTYAEIPAAGGHPLFDGIYSYTDTADEGSDYLCSIIFGVYRHEAYVLDVYYTKEPMEVTEPEVGRRQKEHGVGMARIESNNGGKGFARAIKQILENKLNWYSTSVRWFAQSKNKVARILTAAPWILEHVYYPVNWRDRWPAYYNAMAEYQREGKNAHDDAPDATTGMAETVQAIR